MTLHRLTLLTTILAGSLALMSHASLASERTLSKNITVNAPLAEVWHAWTTEEGLQFISGKSRVELMPGGAYEWFLDLEPDELGYRGGERSHLLAVLPEDVLVFNWTFPPPVPTLRASGAMTQVVVRFEAIDDDNTHVRLDVGGWQDGDDWDAGYAYFDRAWTSVLDALRAHFDAG